MSNDQDAYFIGVDGGGSGCRAVIADRRGVILGRGDAGAANATSDMVLAVIHVREALAQAAEQAKLSPEQLAATPGHVGLAGILDIPMARQVASELPFRARVSDDRRTFLAGALGDRRGILLGVGTGTIVARWDGRTARYLGGYGLNLSDQASGGWIGWTALSRSLLAHDGVLEQSELSTALMTEFGNQPAAMIGFAQRATPADYAGFAPKVVKAADRGDAIAAGIMRDGADYLVRAVEALGFPKGGVLCLAGGVGPRYASWLPDHLRSKLARPLGGPLDGALSLAMAR